jgi:transposase-like protein
MDALDIIRKHAEEADIDFLRETLQVVLHAVMDADVSQQIGADQRTPSGSASKSNSCSAVRSGSI